MTRAPALLGLAIGLVLVAGLVAVPRISEQPTELAPAARPSPMAVETPPLDVEPDPLPPPEPGPEHRPSETEPLPEPSPEPPPDGEPAINQDPAALWGRTFVSVSVTEHGQPRTLLPGTQITVEFEHREPEGTVAWHSGCNRQGAHVLITPKQVHTREITTTDVGCASEHHDQDAWTAQFFSADPFWVLEGSRLRLVARGTVIVFQEP